MSNSNDFPSDDGSAKYIGSTPHDTRRLGTSLSTSILPPLLSLSPPVPSPAPTQAQSPVQSQVLSSPQPATNQRWQNSSFLSTTPALGTASSANTHPVAAVSYKGGSIVYDQETGELGFEDPSAAGRVSAAIGVHPTFRSIGGELASSSAASVDIDEVLLQWKNAATELEVEEISASLARPQPYPRHNVPAESTESSFSNPSSEEDEAVTPKATPSPSTKFFSRLRSPKVGSPATSIAGPSQDPTKTKAWQLSALSEEMGTYRKRHGLLPLELRPIDEETHIHPNHRFTWSSAKLSCRLEHEGQCTICGSSCCLFESLRFKIDNNLVSVTPGGEAKAIASLQELKTCCGNGVEGFNTFLRCTGCERKVCPSCAGRCSEEMCRDVVCKHCVPEPWKKCSAHLSQSAEKKGKKGSAAEVQPKKGLVAEMRKKYSG